MKRSNDAFDAAADLGVASGVERNGRRLEPRFVVLLEQAGGQISDGVLAQVGRKVGDADAIVRIDLAVPDWTRRRQIGDGELGAEQLIGRRRRHGQNRKRMTDRLALAQHGQQVGHVGVEFGPVADTELGIKAMAGGKMRRQFGIQIQGPVIGGKSLGEALELEKDVAAAEPRRRQIRHQRQRPVIGPKGLVVTPKLQSGHCRSRAKLPQNPA